MWVYDLETLRFLAVNNAAVAHYGYARDEFLSMTIADIRPPEDVPALLKAVAAHRKNIGNIGVWRHLKKDGSLIEVEITAHDFVFESRQARLAIANDVTEQRATQRTLQNLIASTSSFGGDDFFNALVQSLAQSLGIDTALVTTWSKKSDSILQSLAFWHNDALQPNFEYSIIDTPCETVIRDQKTVFYPENVDQVFPLDEFFKIHNTNSYYGAPMRSSGGDVRGHLCVMDTRPMRNRQRIETAFSLFGARMTLEIERMEAESESAKFVALAQNSSDFIAITSAERKLLFLNQAGRDLVGLENEVDLSALRPHDFMTPEAEKSLRAQVAHILAHGSWRGQSSLRHCQSGEEIPVEITSFALKNPLDGKVFGLATIQRDIREQKAAERALQNSEERYRSIVQAAEEGIMVFDMDCIITFANPRLEKMLGHQAGAMIGQSMLQLIFEDEMAKAYQCLENRRNGQSDSTEYGFRCRDGSRIDVVVSGAPMYNDCCEVVGVLDMVTDITERKRADRALHEAERRQSVLLQNAPVIIFALDLDGVFTMAAGKGLEAISKTSEQAIGTSAFEKYRDAPRVLESLRRALRGESFIDVQDFGEISFQTSYNPLYDAVGNLSGTMGIATDISSQRRAELALREAEQKYRGLFEHAIEGIFQTTADGHYVTANPMLAQIYGYDSPEELMRQVSNISQQIYIEPGRREQFIEQMKRDGQVSRFESPVRKRDGSIIWISENAREMRDDNGELIGYEGTTVEISELKEAEAALRVSESRTRDIVEHSSNMFYSHTTDHVLTYVSPQASHFFDCEPSEVLGQWTDLITDNPLNQEGFQICQRAIETGERQSPYRLELQSKKGRKLWVEVNEAPVVRDGRTVAIVGALVDVTKRTEAEQKLQHQAFHDALTGLPNRALFMDRLQHALDRSKNGNNRHAILFLDLDRFKVVNDSLGHETGDQLLRAVADRLKSCLRARDTSARLGGDEFVVLLEDIGSVQDAVTSADCIASSLKEPFVLSGHELFITTSVGIKFIDTDEISNASRATSSTPSSTPSSTRTSSDGLSEADCLESDCFSAETHLRDADVAMYRAKSKGRSQYELFDPEMNARAVERLRIESDLRAGIERGEMRVWYQPLVRLSDEKIIGFEALVRWQHPTLGLIAPHRFIEIAEEVGLILPLGEWVLSEACRQLQAWLPLLDEKTKRINIEMGGVPLYMSVNLSSRQFRQQNLAEQVKRVLDEAALDARHIILEITESVVMEEAEQAIGTLRALRDLGVQIAIDDFGTGYSSLSYLKRFPVSILKIDRSFVSNLEYSTEDNEIVRTIVSLGRVLGLRIVAEGVETRAQWQHLDDLHCDSCQGYLFSRPLPADEAARFLTS